MTVLDSEDGNKGTLHQKRVLKEKESDECMTLHSLSELFRRQLCHLHRYITSQAPSTYTLHVVTTDIFPDILLHEAYSVHAYS